MAKKAVKKERLIFCVFEGTEIPVKECLKCRFMGKRGSRIYCKSPEVRNRIGESKGK